MAGKHTYIYCATVRRMQVIVGNGHPWFLNVLHVAVPILPPLVSYSELETTVDNALAEGIFMAITSFLSCCCLPP